MVSATAVHPGGALATHTHGFTHAGRCERQVMRLDHGTAEVRVEGWIPLRAHVEPPRRFEGADKRDVPYHADWIAYRERTAPYREIPVVEIGREEV